VAQGRRALWRLTSRRGSVVRRESFESSADALEAVRREAVQVLGEGPLKEAFAFRDIAPADQVAARFEITAPGILRLRECGLDVKGDGSLVPYTGAIRKEPIELEWGDDPYEVLRRALEGLR
jgi:hypothetical protein